MKKVKVKEGRNERLFSFILFLFTNFSLLPYALCLIFDFLPVKNQKQYRHNYPSNSPDSTPAFDAVLS